MTRDYSPVVWPVADTLLERQAIFIYEGARMQAAAVNAPIIPEPWVQRDEEFRAQFLDITATMMGPDRFTDPEAAHDSWWRAYQELGWTYGPVRDVEAKTHPDMVPFASLGYEERIKDAVWIALCEIARQWITEGEE
ncbi:MULTISPECIES: RyR domain-containing protein [Mycobacteroides]|uniref:RyR domain-containing protein n=1 Tax=Mycobacteroides TaxID=670516 RepID=UPI000929F9DA|nr:RyR domain-containing protein [Mycobacteroides abscessus]NGX06421.1 ryR domain protein [Mycobacteroides franklinii]SHT24848.1 RyR domain [Mycobacteroides abscessus subsp. abscessus]SHW68660.1 RyR domain [Mycobacteroides abscessus subsp. abscessus]SHY70370.1 RyR domain [Mycobacteroides abscessus subsp. abscessus]SHZ44824.1 RyR domain [Mycobacteroides abscessus subsp. abscessus]